MLGGTTHAASDTFDSTSPCVRILPHRAEEDRIPASRLSQWRMGLPASIRVYSRQGDHQWSHSSIMYHVCSPPNRFESRAQVILPLSSAASSLADCQGDEHRDRAPFRPGDRRSMCRTCPMRALAAVGGDPAVPWPRRHRPCSLLRPLSGLFCRGYARRARAPQASRVRGAASTRM